jgi:hypothetical protein
MEKTSINLCCYSEDHATDAFLHLLTVENIPATQLKTDGANITVTGKPAAWAGILATEATRMGWATPEECARLIEAAKTASR